MIELSKGEYAHILPLLKNLAYEPVFAYSVIERNQSGKVFVDRRENPTCGLIINLYGQYLLTGSGDNESFMNDVVEFLLNDQNHSIYYDLYVSTPDLLFQIGDRLAGKTVLLYRSSFTFELSQFQHLKTLNSSPEQFVMKRMDGILFDKYKNEMDASYDSLWSSAQNFIDRGFGYCLVKDDQFASVCNSYFVGRGYADIDIVTVDEYQNKGLATLTGTAFIEHCLNHNLLPNYSCDAGNERSIQLAKKLGFAKKIDFSMLWWHQDQSIISDYLKRFNYSNTSKDK
ncbi:MULTISPECIES: GNAT family N-acetyltransferase [unclassified Paenibacillus]|uniref:GNAT family N-acetyltransferase n=1 Tax=unclassified Paenibacillus TaxID=185978 RepID=UPI0030D211AE